MAPSVDIIPRKTGRQRQGSLIDPVRPVITVSYPERQCHFDLINPAAHIEPTSR
jgi:hypothetical protein